MTFGDARIEAIRPWLVDLERALWRDGSHAIVTVAHGPEKELLLRAFPEHVSGRLRSAAVSLGARAERDVAPSILRALGADSAADPQEGLVELARQLARRGTAVALLLEDAASLPPGTVALLRSVALAAQPDLRLALFVPPDAEPEGGGVCEVARRIGLGAQKIQLTCPSQGDAALRPRRPPTPHVVRLASGGAVEAGWSGHERAGLGLEVHMGSGPPEARRARAAAPLGVLLVLCVAFAWAAGMQRGTPGDVAAAPPGPLASETLRSERAVAFTAPVAVKASAPGAPPPRALAPLPEPPRAKPPPPTAAPARARVVEASVRVNLNATPWARIEVDGRDVGPTPIAGLRLTAGEHDFRAHMPDGRVLERRVRVDAYRDRIAFP